MRQSDITDVLNRPISLELLARGFTRMAYVAKDGTPRSIPIGFVWNGSTIVMCTAKNAPKLPAPRRNSAVALTIDTEVHPPRILLIRGRAALDVVEGILDEFFQVNEGSYAMTMEQRTEWEAEAARCFCQAADECSARRAGVAASADLLQRVVALVVRIVAVSA